MFLFAASLLVLYIGYERYLGLGADVVKKKEELASLQVELSQRRALTEADSLLFANKFKAALAAYDALENSDSLGRLKTEIAQRTRHTCRVRRMLISVDTLSTKLSRIDTEIPTPIIQLSPKLVRPAPLSRARPNQYDSLTFALETVRIENATLKRRLAAKAASDYLSFKSTKGNDVFYVGQVRRKKANGEGYGLLSTGSRYVGEWKDNLKHGQGKFYWKDGAYYEGEFANDMRDGQGTYHFPSGEIYIGSWKDGARNGPGVIYSKDKKVVAEGEWKNDKLMD